MVKQTAPSPLRKDFSHATFPSPSLVLVHSDIQADIQTERDIKHTFLFICSLVHFQKCFVEKLLRLSFFVKISTYANKNKHFPSNNGKSTLQMCYAGVQLSTDKGLQYPLHAS